MATSTINVLSLCSGAGGLDLAIKLALPASRTVCVVEGEAYAVEIMARRMQEGFLDDAPIWSDLKTFDGKPWRGKVDCVIGGYPCQPFSVAGKRKGVDDPRHLWPDIARILEEVQPWLCFFENVSGHVNLGLPDVVVPDLRRLGYNVPRPLLLEAGQVGSPQRRERLFILAYRGMANASGNNDSGRGLGSGMDTRPEAAQDRREGIADGIDDVRPTLANPAQRGRGELREPSGGDGLDAGSRRKRRKSRKNQTARNGTRGPELGGRCDGLGNADGSERGPDRREDGSGARGQGERPGESVSRHGEMGDSGEHGRRERGSERGAFIGRSSGEVVPYWPPGPASRDEWARILAVRPDLAPATAPPESGVCELVAGIPGRLGKPCSTRTDELRALGNAVVPACGAAAFLILLERLIVCLPEE